MIFVRNFYLFAEKCVQMNSGKLHITSLVKHCGSVSKLILLISLTCCFELAFAEPTFDKTYTSGNNTVTGNVSTTNAGGKDYFIRNNGTEVTVKENLTISDKTTLTIVDGAKLIVEKNLTIGTTTDGTGAGGAGNEAALSLKNNSVLIVKGNLTLNDNAKLKINEGGTDAGSGAIVYVEGDLIINGRDKNPSEVMAKNNAIMIVKGDLVLDAGTNKEGNPEGKIKVESGASITITGEISGTGKVEFPGPENGGKGYFSVLGGIAEGENDIRFEIGEVNKLSEGLANSILYIEGVDNISVSGPGAEGGVSVSVSNQSNSSAYAQSISNIVTVPILLPIELTSFSIFATADAFTFNWITSSEVNNDYFTLEYSIDGVNFNEIDYVHGAGTTSETSEYEYRWDEVPDFEMLYFRLKQTDYNGEYSYSDVLVSSRKKSSGANGTFRYGPLNFKVVDGQLQYIVK